VGRGIVLTVDWNRHAYPSPWTAGLYRFSRHPMGVPDAPVAGGGTAKSVVQAYSGTSRAVGTHVNEPYAGLLRGYQTWAFLRGPMLALVLTVGLTGLLRHRHGGALPWTMAVCLLTVPLLTTDFDYRYLLPATPLTCVAAALTFGRRPSPVPVPEPPARYVEAPESEHQIAVARDSGRGLQTRL
jgi:hypothetical protein